VANSTLVAGRFANYMGSIGLVRAGIALPRPNTTLLDEFTAAARGVFALLRGDRRAPEHFDLGPRGLAGSLIALLLTLLAAYLPSPPPAQGAAVAPSTTVFVGIIVYLTQLGGAALALRQMNRSDGLVPFLVADNWASFWLSVVFLGCRLLGVNPDLVLVVGGIVAFIAHINIARLIVTLSAMQIALLIVAQLVGAGAGVIIVQALLSPAAALSTPPV